MTHLERRAYPIGQGAIQRIELPTLYQVGSVNAYLLEGRRPTLVDCGIGLPESNTLLQDTLRELGYGDASDKQVVQIILTHHHPDHAGGLTFLLNPDNGFIDAVAGVGTETSIPLIGHAENNRWLNPAPQDHPAQRVFWRRFFQQCGLPASMGEQLITQYQQLDAPLPYRSLDRTVTTGDSVMAGDDEWIVLHTPGHAGSQICLYRQRDGTLISGDHLLPTISSNAFVEPPPAGSTERSPALLQYRIALRALLELPISQVFPGHGPDFDNAHDLVQRRLTSQQTRATTLLELIGQGVATTLALSRALFPRLDDNALFLGLSEVIGHLDLLVEQCEIVAHTDAAGTLLWTLAPVSDRQF